MRAFQLRICHLDRHVNLQSSLSDWKGIAWPRIIFTSSSFFALPVTNVTGFVNVICTFMAAMIWTPFVVQPHQATAQQGYREKFEDYQITKLSQAQRSMNFSNSICKPDLTRSAKLLLESREKKIGKIMKQIWTENSKAKLSTPPHQPRKCSQFVNVGACIGGTSLWEQRVTSEEP